MYTINIISRILEAVKSRNVTDIHFTAGAVPAVRIEGKLIYVTEFRMARPDDINNLVSEMLNDEYKKRLEAKRYTCATVVIKNIGRMRANIYQQRNSFAVNIKLLDKLMKTPEELGLPSEVIKLCERKSGLILICGNKNSGKSTTAAAIIKEISMSRECHIITVENPIEYLHKHDKSIINQKEVGIDVGSFAEGLSSAMNQDADVIMTSYAGDAEMFSLIFSAAENGHLVIAILQTVDSVSTINYITEMFPEERRNHIRILLGSVLQAIVSQRLLPGIADIRKRLALEVMLANQAVKNLIIENKIYQIPTLLRASRVLGMTTMEDSIKELCDNGVIDKGWINS
jgi:twitching motility protein PilT